MSEPDEARAEKLKQLQLLKRLGVSEIAKRAIDLLHRQQAGRAREKLDALLSSDFVGRAAGPEDLAKPIQGVSDTGSREQFCRKLKHVCSHY